MSKIQVLEILRRSILVIRLCELKSIFHHTERVSVRDIIVTRILVQEPKHDIGPAESGNMKKKISRETSDKILDKMGYKFNPVEFYLGMNSELEHKDVTHGNMVMTAKIAAAHLKENPKYYSLLKTIEKKVSEQGAGVGAAPAAAAPALGLTGPGGVIRGAPKPKDVKKMRTHLNKEKDND